MKNIIAVNIKKSISIWLAFIMLMLTVFVADTTVVKAASKLDAWDGSKKQPTATDSNGNIIINTAEELAWIALYGGENTRGKSYKVADNMIFDLNGMQNITINSTADDVKSATRINQWRFEKDTKDIAFAGNFDGNGLVVYNLYTQNYGYAGLFPAVYPTTSDTMTIKNVKVVASHIVGYHGAGGIAGIADATDTKGSIVFEGCEVSNCYISDNNESNTECSRTAGGIVGLATHNKATVKGCLVKDNLIVGTNITGGFIGNTSAYASKATISNSIAIGTSPVSVVSSSSSVVLQSPMINADFTNVYTNLSTGKSNITTLAVADMSGNTGKTKMSLDWENLWFVNSGLPEPRGLHKFEKREYAANAAEGHTDTCTVCGLQGLAVTAHNLQEDAYNTGSMECVDCGYSNINHTYTTTMYLEDPQSGHIKTCSDCGKTTGELETHNMQTDPTDSGQLKCTVCGYIRIKAAPTDDDSYFAQAVKGEQNPDGSYNDMYRYNLSGSGMINPTYELPYGQNSFIIGKAHAIFAQYETLSGTGTENDPYIINDALTLYRVMASGGTNYSAKLYYKLGCDINLNNKQWIDLNERWVGNAYLGYRFLAFNGELDGNGHTITGLRSQNNNASVGFVPVLGSNGVIKNLHFENAVVYSFDTQGVVGIVVGTALKGSQIINCSAEYSVDASIVGQNYGSVKNSCVISSNDNDIYYDGNGNTVTSNKIDLSANNGVWYKGGNDSKPRLLNKANTVKFADINGDGEAYGYDISDVTALKNHLLWVDGYENVCGDVDSNGKINITDLAVLQRYLLDDYNQIDDGFWRNVELNKFGIYYTDNDNYDFARKLELYFKNTIGVNVQKQKQSAPNQFAIVLKKDDTIASDYTINYDNENAVLTFSGKSFTAVEQAVLDFIKKSDYKTSTVYETANGMLSDEKQSVMVNNKEYHYAWGDEFDDGSVVNGNTTVNYGKWNVRDMGSDNTVGAGNTSQYRNLKFADNIGLSELNVVKDGKLTMHRGVGYGAEHVGEKTGYLTNLDGSTTFDINDIATSGVLYTKHSMLFKRGYLEMKCTLPSDGYAFPAWWLMTNAGNNNPEVTRSLYSKVYEFNEDYDRSYYYTPDNYKTYKYKLPTATFEIDIFEIIQQPGKSDSIATPSYNNKYQYTIHKWYIHSKTVRGNNLPMKVYDLDWTNVKANGGFTQVFDATYSDGKYVENWSTMSYHANNMASGQMNADISRTGNKTGKYTRSYLDAYYTPVNNQTSATFGFLWDEEQLSQYIYIDGVEKPIIRRIDIADLDYDGMGYDMEQYAYMLMENHLFTNPVGQNTILQNLNDCTMVVDYVRLYQLDGHRDIVIPETEAFNNPVNRFN